MLKLRCEEEHKDNERGIRRDGKGKQRKRDNEIKITWLLHVQDINKNKT